MKKKIITFIIYIVIFGWLVYEFGIPKYKTINSHKDSMELYTSIDSDSINWQTAGYSANGNKIYLMEAGASEKSTLIFGGIHGDENGAFNLTLRFARFIYLHPQLLKKKVIIVPSLNPDGLIADKRKNGDDVDINRNFPSNDWTPVYADDSYYPGSEPASEPETNIAMRLINKYKPEKVISIHSTMHLVDYKGPARSLANEISKYNGYKVTTDIGYKTPGSLESYAGKDLGIPIVTIELPAYDPDQAWKENKDALIHAINF